MDHLGGLLALIALGLAACLLARRSRQDVIHETGRIPLLLVSGAALAAIIAASLELDALSKSTPAFLFASILAIFATAIFILVRFEPTPYAFVAMTSIALATLFIAWRGWGVLAITLAIAAIGALIWMSDSRTATRYTGLLITAGAFAAGGVELVYVVDDLQSLKVWYRMNTLFKIYNEVWITLGLGASAFVGALVIRLANDDTGDASGRQNDAHFSPNVAPLIIAAASAVVVAAGLLYPLLATAPRLELRFPGHPGPTTLNALDWMRYGTIQSAAGETITFDEDLDVIDWFYSEVAGTPVIAEASIGPYRGNGSRISIATGLPTVLGWDRHERQQRYLPEIAARNVDLAELYNSTDPRRKIELLEKYDVEFVIVGDVERKTIVEDPEPRPYASQEGLEAFESMVGDSLEIAFQSGETVVYRVIQ
jgi:uncharacterized membrane protein